jgi:dihydrofolate reductase
MLCGACAPMTQKTVMIPGRCRLVPVGVSVTVAGSIRLVRTLVDNDLVDELRLMIYPVVLGAGERLFGETSDQRLARLVETRTVHDLAYLTYEVVREAA